MNNTPFLIGVLLLLSATTNSQTNYKDATVIAKNGDTLHGKIDYRNWRTNPKSVSFMGGSGQINVYTPADIREFQVQEVNERYVSASVTVDPLTDNPNKALEDLTAEAVSEQNYFLLQLVNHPSAGLLLLSQGDRDHYYFRKGQDKPVELIHHYEVDKVTGQLNQVSDYKGQLAGLFNSCPGAVKDIDRLRYQTQDLEKAFRGYLQCAYGVTVSEQHKNESLGVRFGVVAGVSHTQYSLEGDNTILVDDNYTASTSPVIGGMVDVSLSRNLNHMHIVNELVYKNYKTGSTFTRPYGNGYTSTSTVEFNLSYLQLNTMLRYLFVPLAKVNPYVNLGISNAVMIAETKNYIHTAYSFGNEETGEAIPGIKKHELTTIVAGVGVNSRHFTAELRYSYNKRGFSPQITLNTNPRTWWVLLTYKF